MPVLQPGITFALLWHCRAWCSRDCYIPNKPVRTFAISGHALLNGRRQILVLHFTAAKLYLLPNLPDSFVCRKTILNFDRFAFDTDCKLRRPDKQMAVYSQAVILKTQATNKQGG